MTTKKNSSTPTSESAQLIGATKSKVSTVKPQVIMQSDNSTNSTKSTAAISSDNSTSVANSDNTINNNASANTVNLFDSEQTETAVSASTDPTGQPKQQRIGKQQRKTDFAEFKATFLAPAKLMNRHALNIESDLWDQLERVSRILGDRGTTVSSYACAIIAEHLKQYADDIEIWRKL